MSYEKQTWQTGDTVTSAKLNHMEDGIAAGGSGGEDIFIVNMSYDEEDNIIFDKTFAEAEAAILAGKVLLFNGGDGGPAFGRYFGGLGPARISATSVYWSGDSAMAMAVYTFTWTSSAVTVNQGDVTVTPY